MAVIMAFYDQSYPSWSGPSRASPFENRPSTFFPSDFFPCVAVLTHQDLPKLDEHYAFNHQLEGILPVPLNK